MNEQILYKSIGKIALGYFFIYFNFNLGTFNLLPIFVGYLLILYAIGALEQEEPELRLLRPFAVILAVWHTAGWILSCFSVDIDGFFRIAELFISVINLYFHFQLLTNLASIAAAYQSDEDEYDVKLKRCRTIQTVLLTAVIIIGEIADYAGEYTLLFSVPMAIVYIIAGILIIKALLDFRKCLLHTDDIAV